MNWLRHYKRRLGVRIPQAPIARPVLECLEAREVPAALGWTGAGGNDLWSNPSNWNLTQVPVSGDTIAFPANAFSIQDIAGLSLDRVTLTGGNTVLLQQQLTLNGSGGDDQVVASGATNAVVGVGGLNLVGSAVEVSVAAASTLQFTTDLTGPSGLRKDGDGTLQLDRNASYQDPTFVRDGVLALSSTGFNTALPNTTLFIGDGVGTALTAEVRLLDGNQIPNTAQINISADGFLNLFGNNEAVGNISMSGNVGTGGGDLLLNGNVTVNADGAFLTGPAGGTLTLGAGDRTFTVAAGKTLTLFTKIEGSGGLLKDGAGTINIDTSTGVLNNTYTGATTVKDGGLILNHDGNNTAISNTLVIGDGTGAAGSAFVRLLKGTQTPVNTSVTVRSDGRFDLNGFLDAVGSVTLGDANGGGQVTTGTGSLILTGTLTSKAAPTSSTISGKLDIGASPHTFVVEDGAAPNDLVIDANVSAAPVASFTKTGTGVLALNGANTFGGPATVNAGTLRVNGTQPNVPANVVGGVLAGTGAVGAVTGVGGTVAPGVNAAGTLSMKNLKLGAATYAAELNGAAANQFDRLQVFGTVNLTGSTLAPSLGFASSTGTPFRIIDNDAADPVVGKFNGLSEGATFPLGGRTFRITYQGGTGNDVVLTDITPPGGSGGSSIEPQPYAVGTDIGGGPLAVVYNPDGSPKSSFQVFEAGFVGGVRTATGDVNGDGVAELIVGSGPGRVGEVRIHDGVSGQLIRSVQPFDDFTGGVFVAAGDFDNDGLTDVVITPDLSGGPRVTVVSGKDGSVLANFFGIDDAAFRGGARAAAGDVNGDGKDDLVISAGFGGGPRIAVFDGTTLGGTPTRLMPDFFAFEQTLRNGAYVAAGDLNADGKDDLIFGGGPGGGPRVLALDAATVAPGDMAGAQLANFFAGNVENRGGIRVVAKNLDGDGKADIVVGDGEKAGSRVTAYLGATIGTLGTPPAEDSFDAFPGFTGGVFVG